MRRTLVAAGVAAATALAAVTASAVGLDPDKITGLTAAPTDAGDAANKAYVDDLAAYVADAFAAKLDNVIRVSSAGGDYTSVGDAVAFLQGLIDGSDPAAPSVDNKWVVFVGPGVYEGGVNLTPYTSLVGAGGGTTCATTLRLTDAPQPATPVVRLQNRSELRDMCVESEAGAETAIGVLTAAGVSTMENVSVSVAGKSAEGIFMGSNSALRGSGLRVSAEGQEQAYGLSAGTGTTPDIRDSTFTAGAAAPQSPAPPFAAVFLNGPGGSFLSGVTADGGQTALALEYQSLAAGLVLASRLLGDVVIHTNSQGVIVNSVIEGSPIDANGGFRNCRGNYGLAPGTPANANANSAASYEGGTNSNFFGEVDC